MTDYFSLLGLGFGDCGKGLFTDALCHSHQAHTVVRFNGGAQAGHNVVLADGRHHTFSQIGAGSFRAGVRTVLAQPMVVHPHALLIEADALARVGVPDALARLAIDARCRVTTPFHQAAGRLREWKRGVAAHGSCGVGVGETVLQELRDPAAALRYGDLPQSTRALEKLELLRVALVTEFADAASHSPEAARELGVLHDPGLAQRWLAHIAPCIAQVPPTARERIAEQIDRRGTVLFEGAQGVLLDEWRGFHPHTSWSKISTHAVEAVLAELGIHAPVRHFGVLRSYLTRHGAGPLPTHDPELDMLLAEPHNASSGWQGAFRRGHPDEVLLRYAIEAIGALDGLLVSHLDVFDKLPSGLRWCTQYRSNSNDALTSHLPLSPRADLRHQETLMLRLSSAQPVYDASPVVDSQQWLAHLASITRVPVRARAFGATREAVFFDGI